ncbi:thioredoxin family protein [Luteolibacter flavescens]|uniref:Thioredoxin family protein n=1 Tax=Luteolibacter flavescens TaxID=1859460 RepID=A0ABT3FUE4_9BACT|nr:thioredoxin family protein [Luteolibacter flavescens]MCW1886819.1 thioredoxin family protein [Luteolibacter flavescens]
MKTKAFLLFTLLAGAAFAAEAPRGSFTGADYEAARAKSKETGKPIAVVVTDTESTCPMCQSGNEAIFKQMRSDYILVIEDEARKDKLPGNIKQATYETYKTKGNVIPIVTVFSSEADNKILGGMCYKQIGEDSRKAFKNLDAEVEKAAASVPAKAAETKDADKSSGMREWTNAEGKKIKAELVSSTDTKATFKLENGKTVEYALDKLSKESREEIEDAR